MKLYKNFSNFFKEAKNYLTIEQLNIIFQDSYKKINNGFYDIKLILTAPNLDENLNSKIFELYKNNTKTMQDYEKMYFIELFCKNNKNTNEMNDFFFNQIKNYEIDPEESDWKKQERNSAIKEFLPITHLTQDILDYFKNSTNSNEIIGLIKNPSLPKETLNEILKTNNIIFKEYLSLSKETPINILEQLLKDKNIEIQKNAYKTLDILFEEFEKGELDLDF